LQDLRFFAQLENNELAKYNKAIMLKLTKTNNASFESLIEKKIIKLGQIKRPPV